MPSPTATPLPRHGGDLALATRLYGIPAGGWIDLSTGVNPDAYPVPSLPADALARLPDRAALAQLIAIARRAYSVPDGVDLVAVPGTEIAIRLLPIIAPAGKVAIVSPTYGSHADAWSERDVTLPSSIAGVPVGTSVTVVVNPNNPDGRTTTPDDLKRLAASSFVVIDEAFADVAPETSFIPAMAGVHALVLRSFGKFYGLAGLRLGFVAAAPGTAANLATLLGDWPVSSHALLIGQAALADDAWRVATRTSLAVRAAALRSLLTASCLPVVGGTDLFVLVNVDEAISLHVRLAAQGIWTRAFAEQPRWLRFGLPTDAGMDRLAQALSAVR